MVLVGLQATKDNLQKKEQRLLIYNFSVWDFEQTSSEQSSWFSKLSKVSCSKKKKLAQRHDNEAEIIIRSGKEPGKKSTYYNLGAYEPLG